MNCLPDVSGCENAREYGDETELGYWLDLSEPAEAVGIRDDGQRCLKMRQ